MALTRLGLNQSINLASNVTGALPVANGGTALTSGFINGVSGPSSHTSVTFANGYTAEGSGTTRDVVFKLSGIVYVMVYCTRSSTPDNNMAVGTLPSGYRPASTKYVGTSIGYQADSTANINVSTNGYIMVIDKEKGQLLTSVALLDDVDNQVTGLLQDKILYIHTKNARLNAIKID